MLRQSVFATMVYQIKRSFFATPSVDGTKLSFSDSVILTIIHPPCQTYLSPILVVTSTLRRLPDPLKLPSGIDQDFKDQRLDKEQGNNNIEWPIILLSSDIGCQVFSRWYQDQGCHKEPDPFSFCHV